MARVSLWRSPERKILASKSAARRALLEAAALPVESEPADVDERAIDSRFLRDGGTIPRLAAKLAAEKALAVSRRAPDAFVIGADQTMTLARTLFHKAASRAEARENLLRLSGRKHRLTSAVALAQGGALVFTFEDFADMTMRKLSEPDIERYLDVAGEGALQSVGGYQLEGVGVHLFSRVVGAHSTILGLPMMPLLAWLRDRSMIGP
jgi:septum formation protein